MKEENSLFADGPSVANTAKIISLSPLYKLDYLHPPTVDSLLGSSFTPIFLSRSFPLYMYPLVLRPRVLLVYYLEKSQTRKLDRSFFF